VAIEKSEMAGMPKHLKMLNTVMTIRESISQLWLAGAAAVASQLAWQQWLAIENKHPRK